MLLLGFSQSSLAGYDSRVERSTGALGNDWPFASENFVRMGFQAAAVANNTLIADGGIIYWKNLQNQTQSSSMNWTLTIDLSQSWEPGDAPIQTLVKDGAPTCEMGLLWADDDERVFSFGGILRPFRNETISTSTGSGLWEFTGTNWSQVLSDMSPSSPSLTDISPAQGSGAFGNSVGYALGGYTQTEQIITGLLSYNSTSNLWSNDSIAPAITPFGLVGTGMVFASSFGTEGILLVFGGQYAAPGTFTAPNANYLSFSNISIFDIASRTWSWQITTGDIPQPRITFCSTAAESPQGTYEIFVYGGVSNSDAGIQTDPSVVYILSVPGFVWFRSNDTSAQPRQEHTCNSVGRQVISWGGRHAEMPLAEGYSLKDPWPQGLGIFDMVDLKWTGSYNASSLPYTLPVPIQEWYNLPGSNSSIQWTSPDVRSLFSPNATNASANGSFSARQTGAVAGLVVSCIIFAILAAVTTWWLLRRRRRRRQPLAQVSNIWTADKKGKDMSQELPAPNAKEEKGKNMSQELPAPNAKLELGSLTVSVGYIRRELRAEVYGSSVLEMP